MSIPLKEILRGMMEEEGLVYVKVDTEMKDAEDWKETVYWNVALEGSVKVGSTVMTSKSEVAVVTEIAEELAVPNDIERMDCHPLRGVLDTRSYDAITDHEEKGMLKLKRLKKSNATAQARQAILGDGDVSLPKLGLSSKEDDESS